MLKHMFCKWTHVNCCCPYALSLLELKYSRVIMPKPYLLASRIITLPGHHKLRFWIHRISELMSSGGRISTTNVIAFFTKWQTLQIYVILLKLNTVRHGLMSFLPCLKQWSALCVWIHCLYSARIAITEACHVASEIYLYSLNNIRNRIST